MMMLAGKNSNNYENEDDWRLVFYDVFNRLDGRVVKF